MIDGKSKATPVKHRLLAVRSPKYANVPFLFMIALLLSVSAFLFMTAQSMGLIFSSWVLLLAGFSGLYVITIIRKEKISRYSTVVAYLLAALLLWAIVPALFGIGQSCTGLFGAQTSCTDVHLLTVVFLLFNPVVAVILSTLCLGGIISLILSLKK